MTALKANQTWSVVFAGNALARTGSITRRIKFLTLTDDFTHRCLGINADFGRGGAYVACLLERGETLRQYPKEVKTFNELEFTCRAFVTWTQKNGIRHILIEPGSPTQKAYMESTNR